MLKMQADAQVLESLKKRGNELFTMGKFAAAADAYTDAIGAWL
jgi:hypothetical protein